MAPYPISARHPGKQKDTYWVPETIDESKFYSFRQYVLVLTVQCLVRYFKVFLDKRSTQ